MVETVQYTRQWQLQEAHTLEMEEEMVEVFP